MCCIQRGGLSSLQLSSTVSLVGAGQSLFSVPFTWLMTFEVKLSIYMLSYGSLSSLLTLSPSLQRWVRSKCGYASFSAIFTKLTIFEVILRIDMLNYGSLSPLITLNHSLQRWGKSGSGRSSFAVIAAFEVKLLT